MTDAKTNSGRFFEDYEVGQTLHHAVPRTVTNGERALYHALYPSRHALYSSDQFARGCGLAFSPLDDLIIWAMLKAAGWHRSGPAIHCDLNPK